MNGWIGVDLDGTLAVYDKWRGTDHIGEPIAPMVERVKSWLASGVEVRVMTARVFPLGTTHEFDANAAERIADSARAADVITKWCVEVFGQRLPLTCVKDYGMVELWDDRAVQVVANTGQRADGKE